MRKAIFLGLALVASTQVGCRMCQNCLDYASPVPSAACGGCHDCRAGTCLGSNSQTTPMVAENATEPSSARR